MDLKDLTSMLVNGKYERSFNVIVNGFDTYLCIACRNNDTELVAYLLEHGADPNKKNCNLDCPLNMACLHRNKEMIQLLLDKGADPNERDKHSLDAMQCLYRHPK